MVGLAPEGEKLRLSLHAVHEPGGELVALMGFIGFAALGKHRHLDLAGYLELALHLLLRGGGHLQVVDVLLQ